MSRGQPCLIFGYLNMEPTRIPCLLKGISAGSWFDVQEAWAHASGTAPGATCKHCFTSTGSTLRDFIIGCPLTTAALGWCKVLADRWVLPHLARLGLLSVFRLWLLGPVCPYVLLPLGVRRGLPLLDKTRCSRSIEVSLI